MIVYLVVSIKDGMATIRKVDRDERRRRADVVLRELTMPLGPIESLVEALDAAHS